MFYTYMIRCSDNSIYTGITTDVERRFREHEQQKAGVCAKYTITRKVISTEAVWQSESRETASRLEYHIKKLTKKKKENLILDNIYFEKYFSEKFNINDYIRIDING